MTQITETKRREREKKDCSTINFNKAKGKLQKKNKSD